MTPRVPAQHRVHLRFASDAAAALFDLDDRSTATQVVIVTRAVL